MLSTLERGILELTSRPGCTVTPLMAPSIGMSVRDDLIALPVVLSLHCRLTEYLPKGRLVAVGTCQTEVLD